MRNRHGFTIVELAIVIAIMGVLLVLAVAKMNSSQITARDHERKSDVQNIARFLEDYYKSHGGTYPATDKVTSANMETLFDGLDKASLKAPGESSYSLKAASSYSDDEPAVNQYIYMPETDQREDINSGGRFCVSGTTTCGICDSSLDTCRNFTIFYATEADEGAIHTIESENS